MSSKNFGRRRPTSRAEGATPLAAESREWTFPLVPVAIGGVAVAVAAAVGLFLAFSNAGAKTSVVVAVPEPACQGQDGCTNKYDVTLSCGSQDEPRTVSIAAADESQAQDIARRYNRGCRARGAVLVASFIKTAGGNAFGAPAAAAAAAPPKAAHRRATRVRTAWRRR